MRKYQDSKRRALQTVYLNDYQHEIYNAAMYGLNMYSPKELHKMPFQKKRKIREFHRKVQRTLNLWKQELVNNLFEKLCTMPVNNFSTNPFSKVFDDTVIGIKKFGKKTDDLFRCTLTFEQLKINRQQIIYKLIQEDILPDNFFQLTKPI